MKFQPDTYLREPCVYPREGLREASVAVHAVGANEHRKIFHLGRRDFVRSRRQHVIHRYGEREYGPTVSKNPRTYARTLSGPGIFPSCPAVVQDRLEKAEDAID